MVEMSSVSVGSLQAEPSSARPDTTIGRRRAIRRAKRRSSLLFGAFITLMPGKQQKTLPITSYRSPVLVSLESNYKSLRQFSCPVFPRLPSAVKPLAAGTSLNRAPDRDTQQWKVGCPSQHDPSVLTGPLDGCSPTPLQCRCLSQRPRPAPTCAWPQVPAPHPTGWKQSQAHPERLSAPCAACE